MSANLILAVTNGFLVVMLMRSMYHNHLLHSIVRGMGNLLTKARERFPIEMASVERDMIEEVERFNGNREDKAE